MANNVIRLGSFVPLSNGRAQGRKNRILRIPTHTPPQLDPTELALIFDRIAHSLRAIQPPVLQVVEGDTKKTG